MPGNKNLPERLASDVETLEAEGFEIEVQNRSNHVFVILKDVVLPDKFDPQKTDILVKVPSPRIYPQGTIDMFWTETEVTLQDGSLPKKADETARYVGREWRRFSYHRGDINDPDWNPAYNDLVDHISFIEQRLTEIN